MTKGQAVQAECKWLREMAASCLREAVEATEGGHWFHVEKAAELAVSKLAMARAFEQEQEQSNG